MIDFKINPYLCEKSVSQSYLTLGLHTKKTT